MDLDRRQICGIPDELGVVSKKIRTVRLDATCQDGRISRLKQMGCSQILRAYHRHKIQSKQADSLTKTSAGDALFDAVTTTPPHTPLPADTSSR